MAPGLDPSSAFSAIFTWTLGLGPLEDSLSVDWVTMADGCVSKLCEKCNTSRTTSTPRQCDMVLCDDCNSNDSKYIEYLINKSFQYEQEQRTSEIEEEDEDAVTGHAHHADKEQEDQNDGKEHNDDSNDMEQSSEKQVTTHSVFVKNIQNTSETCKMCTRKTLNGVRCRECAETTQ